MPVNYSSRDYDRHRYQSREGGEDRPTWDRAADEVRSWFGDRDAERRRRIDDRSSERYREGRGGREQFRFEDMRAHEIMTRSVVYAHPWETVERAARLMRECDCGLLPVVDYNGRLIGMVTDRDIAVRIVARGIDPRRARVEECMTRDAFACHVDDTVEDCMRAMSDHQVRRIPIVDDRDRVVGIISQGDLARCAGDYSGRGQRRAVADMLYAVSEPSREAYSR